MFKYHGCIRVEVEILKTRGKGKQNLHCAKSLEETEKIFVFFPASESKVCGSTLV